MTEDKLGGVLRVKWLIQNIENRKHPSCPKSVRDAPG